MGDDHEEAPVKKRPRPNRWGKDDSASTTASTKSETVPNTAKPKSKALAQSIAQRLAALKQKKLAASKIGSASLAKKRNANSLDSTTPVHSDKTDSAGIGSSNINSSDLPSSTKRAKVYDFDMSVISKPKSIYQKPVPVVKKNPYLAHREIPSTESNTQTSTDLSKATQDGDTLLLDGRLAGGHVEKTRKRHKALTFVEPGKYIELAEKKREKALNAVQSGFTSGRKVGLHHKSVGIVSGVNDSEHLSSSEYYGGSKQRDEEETIETLPPRADSMVQEGMLNDHTIPSSSMPLFMEWWDLDLLPTKLKKEIASKEGTDIAKRTRKRMDMTHNTKRDGAKKDQDSSQTEDAENKELLELQSKCFILASISNSKTSQLIQHPSPVLPLGVDPSTLFQNSATQSTLHLTKKEMKRQRKLRRAEKQREQQDLQAAGLVPPPEPKLTLSNFMRVMGNQAVVDPSQMEKAVLEQMQNRKLKHEQMNQERKLSKEARSQKRRNKLQKEASDPMSSSSISVALFLVKDMTHPYHRAKVDLNAQQMELTGGVLECFGEEVDGVNLSLVIVEGVSKAIKKYIRLMMVRMKWKGEQFEEEESDDEQEDSNAEGEKQGTNKVSVIL